MATDLMQFPTVEEIRMGYKRVYQPFFTVFNDRVAYPAEVGKVTVTEIRSVGDITAKTLGLDDTERKHVLTAPVSKTFNKEFKTIKHIISEYQNKQHIANVSNQVLDALLMQIDRETAAGSSNNGLFASSDPDVIANSSAEIANTFDGAKGIIDTLLAQAEGLIGNGPKIIAAYGNYKTQLNKTNSTTNETWISILNRMYPDVSFVNMPANIVPASTHGLFCMSQSLVRFNYTVLPDIKDADFNKEDNYYWINYLFGSANYEALRYGAIIRQPITIAS